MAAVHWVWQTLHGLNNTTPVMAPPTVKPRNQQKTESVHPYCSACYGLVEPPDGHFGTNIEAPSNDASSLTQAQARHATVTRHLLTIDSVTDRTGPADNFTQDSKGKGRSRGLGCTQLRYKNVCKRAMKACNINTISWEVITHTQKNPQNSVKTASLTQSKRTKVGHARCCWRQKGQKES